MAGNQLPQSLKNDINDPFSAGQLMGMLVVLTFIEKNDGVSQAVLSNLKNITATGLEQYLESPSEDIFLMVENLIKDIK